MLSCPQCHHCAPAAPACPACGFSPPRIADFPAWAPDFAAAAPGYSPSHFEQLFALESGHFWFRARNRLIRWALARYFPRTPSLLEVGCGTGFVLAGIQAEFPGMRLTGAEISTRGLGFAQTRVPSATLVQMDARAMPYVDEFGVVAAFDVLEHIEEDGQVLRGLHRAVQPGGGLLLTVPQHAWLWSPVDAAAGHVRRYAAAGLEAKVRAAGFHILRSTSFVSLALPAMMLSRRRANRNPHFEPSSEYHLGWAANRFLEGLLTLERSLIRLGANLPAGGSRLIIARKTAG